MADSTTRLILQPGDVQQYTSNWETDARTALTRGLAQYLATLAIDMPGGRRLAFSDVEETWAETEVELDYPAAAVYSDAEGMYDESTFNASASDSKKTPDGLYIVEASEFVLPITVEIFAADPLERMGLVKMVEEALNPVDWRYGALLEFGHYYNARGVFSLQRSAYQDSQVTAQQRVRVARMIVTGVVPQTRAIQKPVFLPIRTPILTDGGA